MATTTQNLGLIKPAGTDKIRIAQINSNMDTIDTKIGPVGSTPLQTQATNAASSISALQNGMAIVCNGNTHAAIASGSYAYVRNHSSLAEGLYQATTAIAANATLSSSNLVAVSGGGLNAINDASIRHVTKTFSVGTVVAGQTYTLESLSTLLPSGATYLGAIVLWAAGSSAYDRQALVIEDVKNQTLNYPCNVSQDNLRITVTVLYKK